MTNVSCIFTLVVFVVLFNLYIFFIVPNIAEARPILRFMSFVQWPSSVIKLHTCRYTNLVTFSSEAMLNHMAYASTDAKQNVCELQNNDQGGAGQQ